MRLVDKLLGPRRDDPAVREFEAARAEYRADEDVDGSRYRRARAALPRPVREQLDREGRG